MAMVAPHHLREPAGTEGLPARSTIEHADADCHPRVVKTMQPLTPWKTAFSTVAGARMLVANPNTNGP
jgi:hypothetical protein